MAKRFLLTAGGVDRKGIVFNLANVLKKNGFNIEDSSMVMMRRTFSVIMLLSSKTRPSAGFQKELDIFMKKYKMAAGISEVTEKDMREYSGDNRYMISISGADKKGIVSAMTGVVYKFGGNITGLETKSSEKVKPHAYYMFIEADMPKKTGVKGMEAALAPAAKKLGVHVSVNRVESSAL